MSTNWVFQGRCWKFGDNIPTDALTPTHVMFKSPKEMAAFVLETLNPEFPKQVRPGDILVAGRNFGCSSGRALATKALQATGIGAVDALLLTVLPCLVVYRALGGHLASWRRRLSYFGVSLALVMTMPQARKIK